ncbi:hypothetical protein [Azorhizobium sp. AG788]|uniref:hypothetical protein n=1 Tax=Azorhizobium sp. AG788 TaxID=2183897 RepID=UPI00313A4708
MEGLPLRHELEIWLASTRAGFAALRAGDGQSAARHWAEGFSIAEGSALVRTPFHAVACNNALVGGLIGPGGSTLARETERLHAAWAQVLDMAAHADMALPARSSAFHLLLASRHAQPFSSFLRARTLALATLGQQLGAANALACAGADADASALLRRLDQTQARLPDVLDCAVRAHLAAPFSGTVAASLLARQVAHLQSYRAEDGLPETFRQQMEAALDFCAFAPLAAAVMGRGHGAQSWGMPET